MIRFILPLLLCQSQQDDEARARILIELELFKIQQRQEKKVEPKPSPKVVGTYDGAYADALVKQLPLVIGIGVDPPKGDWITHREEIPWVAANNGKIHRWEVKGILIGVPEGGFLWELKLLAPWERSWVGKTIQEWKDAQSKTAPKKSAYISRTATQC